MRRRFCIHPKKPWLENAWKGIQKDFVDNSYKKVVNKLCSYKIPVVTLRGNMYMESKGRKIADKILKKNKNLITKFTGNVRIQDKNFVLFDISYEPETDHLTNLPKEVYNFHKRRMKSNKNREQKLNKMLKENPDSILITHNPPYGKVDKAYNRKHVGSKIILNAIKKHQPKLALCGHIHEAEGKTNIGKTNVYNLGSRGAYKILET